MVGGPQSIRSTKLYHRQVYSFAYHRPKLALLRESRQHQRFAPLADFLGFRINAAPEVMVADSTASLEAQPNSSSTRHLSNQVLSYKKNLGSFRTWNSHCGVRGRNRTSTERLASDHELLALVSSRATGAPAYSWTR